MLDIYTVVLTHHMVFKYTIDDTRGLSSRVEATVFARPLYLVKPNRRREKRHKENVMTRNMTEGATLRLEAKQRKVCRYCGTDLPTGVCASTHLGADSPANQGSAGIYFAARIRATEKCPHCGVPAGSLHHLSCPGELCPLCGAPLKQCDCAWQMLTSLRIPEACTVCGGTGKVHGCFYDGEPWEEPCPVCSGSGRLEE